MISYFDFSAHFYFKIAVLMKQIIIVTIVLISAAITYSQDSTLILGKMDRSNSGAVYDLSDPTGINIEVNLWGFVRLPGRYRVPINTNFLDIMSYAGGPLEDSKLEDIRIVRTDENTGAVKTINLNYGDLLWEDAVKTGNRMNPQLKAGDIILIPQHKRYSFRENLQFYMPILTSIISVATFIITLRRN